MDLNLLLELKVLKNAILVEVSMIEAGADLGFSRGGGAVFFSSK